MTQLTDDSDRTTYSHPAAQSEFVVPVAATRQLEEGKACKQPTHFGDRGSEKKKRRICSAAKVEENLFLTGMSRNEQLVGTGSEATGRLTDSSTTLSLHFLSAN